MTPGPGIEPRMHWWEASALTTAPSLLLQLQLSGSMFECALQLKIHKKQ